VLSSTRTPLARKASATSSPANGSFRASSNGAEPMIVNSSTPSPSSQHADSQATTPPPTTAIRRGISWMLVTSRDVQGNASRSPGMSGTVAVVPVASTTACRAVSVLMNPSALVTSTDFTPANRP
jgi:hypothetical protein